MRELIHDDNLFGRLAVGAVAGLAGTFALQGIMAISEKWAPETSPPMEEDPGEFMVHKAEEALPQRIRTQVPKTAEKVVAHSLGYGYGMSFGALYALLRSRSEMPVTEGAVLGIASWAVGYLGWLPASGLMKPIWRQKPKQAIVPAVQHALYGVATAAAYDWMSEALLD